MDRRAEILAVAKEMFAEQGIKATTVRQIGARAGILSGSLYHHFGSKLDIVDAILREFCGYLTVSYRQISLREGDPVALLHELGRFAFSLIVDEPAAVLIIQNEGTQLAASKRFDYLETADHEVEQVWLRALEAGVASGDISPTIDARMFYRVVRDIVASSIRWYKPTKGKSIDDVADEVMDLLLTGALTEAGRANPHTASARSATVS